MTKFSRKWLWMALLLSWVAADGARGQWRIVARGAIQWPVSPAFHSGGAIHYKDGIIWAGGYNLVFSTDSGRTWNTTTFTIPAKSLNDGIIDISFLDKNTGVVATESSGLFITHDQGQSWSVIAAKYCWRVAFSRNSIDIYAVGDDGDFLTSSDEGLTWRITNVGKPLSFAEATDGTLYANSISGSPPGISAGYLEISRDSGATWISESKSIDADCFTIDIDSCEPARIYAANENYLWRGDGISKIYLTTDAGQSWAVSFSHPAYYLAGSIANSGNALYAGTIVDGILRSTDKGNSWTNIGGPTSTKDCRQIATISDNIILALDSEGNIWSTFNSGGDSIPLPQLLASDALIIPSRTVSISQIDCVTPADTSIHLNIVGCGIPTGLLDSLWLIGSATFQIAGPKKSPRSLASNDSILLSYKGSSGPDTAILHIRYDIGSGARDTTIQLIGIPASFSNVSGSAQLHREAADAYAQQLDSLVLGVDIGSGVNIDSLWPFISDIKLTYTWDSSVVKYSSYLSPIGCTVTSIRPRGNAVDIAIQNDSSKVSSPLDLGMALFQPSNGQRSTTWVELPRLVLVADCQELSLSVTSDEDNHWAVSTFGAQSGVLDATTLGKIMTIYPNPASGDVWISSSDDLGDVTFAIYDMLGVERSEIVASVSKDNPVELTLPNADGVYNIVANYSSGKSMMRVVREHY